MRFAIIRRFGGNLTSNAAVTEKPHTSFHFNRRQSIGLVLLCTLFGAAAQMLIKTGANRLVSASAIEMLRNPHVFAGYALYGISTVLLILALRDGELSILYPVISLTYVWVTLLSVVVLNETVNPLRLGGLVLIILGVALLGKNGEKQKQ
jgi:multidrug transporter EmrE-like cation transporter